MKSGKVLLIGVVLVVLFSASSSFASQDRYIRLRSVEGEVTVYPADGQRPNEATVNTPLLDGDEIQTGNGRAELSFRNGITVRIGDYSGVRIESAYSPMRINLSQGTLFVDSHLIDRFRDELELRAGDAQVYLIDEGNIRIDLGSEGSVRVTTIEGQAEVQANGRRVLLNSGERTYVDPGNSPEAPEAFYGQNDELDDWNQSRMDNYARSDYAGYDDEYVDQDIYYDSYDLSSYGDWRNSGSYGNVWVPHVDYGWRPYNDGRWIYCNSGWFWVSSEPWGWAPYHYGRWGWSFDLGWYWIPGNAFAPAWVSWYSYGDYVGWCPLNYYNYPIYYNDYYNHNYYYPSIQKQKTLGVADSWTFVRKNDLGVRNVKQALLAPSQVRNIKIEKTQLAFAPKKELTSYVIPKTRQFPSLVNDKRLVKQPEDIKSPLGIKHREDQFERPVLRNPNADKSTKNPQIRDQVRHDTTTLPKPKSNWERDDPRNNKPFNKPQINRPNDQKPIENQKPNDRDWQFKRNESSRQHYSPFLNPYYKGRNDRSDESDSTSKYRDLNYDSRNRDYDPRDRNDSNDRFEDVNPRYRDEAKKYFERFEHKNPPEVESPNPDTRSYERPSRNYTPPSRTYEPPKRDYKAPEIRRPDNNSSRSRPSNNNNNHKPDKPH
jgi:Family of unknown function (DUF6600)/FecR protein